jgi:hypothetical protein
MQKSNGIKAYNKEGGIKQIGNQKPFFHNVQCDEADHGHDLNLGNNTVNYDGVVIRIK